jgi:hypothetical protein
MDPMLLVLILSGTPLVLCRFIQPDDRPAARRPDRKPRPMVDPHWRRQP